MFDVRFAYSPTLLKDLIKEVNGYDELTKENIDSGIFGIIPTDTNEEDFLYALVKKYAYSEIGFDIDEIFIDKFESLWNVNIKNYKPKYELIKNAIENNILTNEKISTDHKGTKSDNETTINTNEIHSTANNTRNEYNNPTVDIDEGLNSNSQANITQNKTLKNDFIVEIDRTKFRVENVEYLDELTRIIDGFTEKFKILFMEVFTII